MNLILFEQSEIEHPLPITDERAQHILNILKLHPGDQLRVGLVNGPKGSAIFRSQTNTSLSFDFQWDDHEEAPPDPITLIIGLSRPHTNQKILQQAAAMGVKRVLFVRTETGEGSYAASKLWSTGEYKRHLLLGAQQARSTRIPVVEYGSPLWIAMHLVEDIPQKIALHNSDTASSFAGLTFDRDHGIVLAIGAERGWSDKEIALLQRNGFKLARFGDRILRTETAVVSALALTKAAMGAWT